MAITSTSLMIWSVCCRKQFKTSRLSSWFRLHELWATAYLNVVKVFSSDDFCSRCIVQSHNSMLYRTKRKTVNLLVSEIVLCSKTFAQLSIRWARGSESSSCGFSWYGKPVHYIQDCPYFLFVFFWQSLICLLGLTWENEKT